MKQIFNSHVRINFWFHSRILFFLWPLSWFMLSFGRLKHHLFYDKKLILMFYHLLDLLLLLIHRAPLVVLISRPNSLILVPWSCLSVAFAHVTYNLYFDNSLFSLPVHTFSHLLSFSLDDVVAPIVSLHPFLLSISTLASYCLSQCWVCETQSCSGTSRSSSLRPDWDHHKPLLIENRGIIN